MSRRAVALGIGVVCTAIIGIQSTQWVFADATAVVPVMDTAKLMKVFAEPLEASLKEAIKAEPTTPRGWRTIADQGNASAEIANLILLRQGEHEVTPEWKQLTIAMRDASTALAAAAEAKSFPEVQAKYAAIIKSCNDCHQKFEPDVAPVIEP